MNELMNNQIQTMTLKEITDLLNVRHNDAMKIVKRMSESKGFGAVTIISYQYSKGNNAFGTLETYQLDKRQSLAVAGKLNTDLLMRVIDRWQELEQLTKPKELTILDYAKALIESDARLQEETRLRLEEKENNQALAQLMNLSNKEEDREDNHWAAVRILKLINK
jgi:hypothetical protein